MLKNKLNPLTVILATLPVLITVFLLLPNKVSALSGSQFSPGRIIDDSVFYNGSSMSVNEIQNFLNTKVPNCDTWGTQPYGGTTRAAYASSKGVSTPFTCLKSYVQSVPSVASNEHCGGGIAGGNKSSAGIIYDVAQACNISPKVLLVLLQKEQSLVTDDWPWPVQYRSATGYGCPDTAPCDSEYYGFFNQVYQAARAYKRYRSNPANYNYSAWRNNAILWNPNSGCGTSEVFIENQATAGLYIYTPYRPNQAALNNLYGTGDGCSSYGNRNFWRMYTDWFGSTTTNELIGLQDHAYVFNASYYRTKYPDIAVAYGENDEQDLWHYLYVGVYEGRQGSASFNINSYRDRYPDLRRAYGSDIQKYLWHYTMVGRFEGRTATGTYRGGVTTSNGMNYAPVYDFDYYSRTYPDIWRAYGLDDQKALWHYLYVGVYEGRQGSASFNINSYRDRYPDLRRAYGSDIQKYLWHYTMVGRFEGRTGV